MARPGIQYEDVKNAAHTLLERGASPSIQRIREVLGTGSNSTIADHLKRWQMELADTPKMALAPALPEALSTAVESFWTVALQQAEAAYQALREAAEERVVSAEQARNQALDAAEQARQQTTVLGGRWEASQQEVRELSDRLLLEQERREQAEAAIQAAEQRREESRRLAEQMRADAEKQVAQFEDLLRRTQDDAANRLQEAAQRLSNERAQSEMHQQRLMQLIEQNRADASSLRQSFDEERLSWKNQEAEWQSRLEAGQARLAANQILLATTEERSRLQEEELAQARTRVRELRDEQLIAVRSAEFLRAELEIAQARIRDLQEKITAVENTVSNSSSMETGNSPSP
ncbi:MAG: DNA-binding protein [Gammaproteobacteria bacterium]|nr:DNA-binding protein [Gammaproteobacteria bacterium]MCP5458072.1 DNA-binding protein [Gammaproteobacteria bacterium]